MRLIKMLIRLALRLALPALIILYVCYLFGYQFGKKEPTTELIASGSGKSKATVSNRVPDEPKPERKTEETEEGTEESTEEVTTSEIPVTGNVYLDYTGEPYAVLNNNAPSFKTKTTETYIKLSDLDSLGRCQSVEACLGRETMPKEGEEREAIGQIKPSGWKQAKYPGVVNSEPAYVWNRAHTLAFCLGGNHGEEVLPKLLVSGTRYMNIEMTGHEIMVARYIEGTGNHVMYRCTPYYLDDELVCRGLELEAYSVEDDGLGISFHVYYYNVQPGISIDYHTGETEYSGVFLDTDSEAVVAPAEEDSEEELEEDELEIW